MKNLNTYLESLLDVDFDVKLTLGDICSFYPHMGGFAPSESKLSLLSWKSDNFLKQFETVSPNNASISFRQRSTNSKCGISWIRATPPMVIWVVFDLL